MLQDQIKSGIKEAMLSRDSVRLATLRLVSAALTNELVAKGKKPDEKLSDEETIAVIARLGKQRKDSIEQFTKGGRKDLADEEKKELAVLEAYLPKMMGPEEILKIARTKKEELGATEPGKLMQALMKELKGKADGSEVKKAVDSLF